MAQDNKLTGAQVGSFQSNAGELLPAFGVSTGSKIELHKYLQRITDQRGPRVVVHEYPNRDGAKVETLGRKPHRSQWDLLYTGSDWVKWITDLVKAIDNDPSGLLIHPIYGQMRVVCQGIDPAVVDVVNAVDTVAFSLVFIEDQVDLGLKEQQGLAAKNQAVDGASSDFQTAAAPYQDAATVAAVTSLVSTAADFSSSAYSAAISNEADPSLAVKLNQVGAALAQVEAAIPLDSVAQQTIAQTYDVIIAGEILYAACLDLADEVALETTGFEPYTVPGDTSIAVLAQFKYGPRAIDVIDEILRLNADKITDATAIPAGTELVLPL